MNEEEKTLEQKVDELVEQILSEDWKNFPCRRG